MPMHTFKKVTKEELEKFVSDYPTELVGEYHLYLSHKHYMYKDKSNKEIKHPHNVVAYRNGESDADFTYFVKE